MKILKMFCGVMAVAVAFLLGNEAFAQKGKSSTGQGLMMDIHVSGQFLIRGSETYAFDPLTAWLGDDNTDGSGSPTGLLAPVDYYNNIQDNASASGAGGTFTDVNGFLVGYKIGGGSQTTPSLAQIIANAVNPGVDATKVVTQACAGNSTTGDWVVFADGGTSNQLRSLSYTRNSSWSVTGYKTVTYTWAFKVAPIADTPIVPLTGWYLAEVDNEGLAKVNINGIVAGESVLVKDGVTKYSFGLTNSDGSSRVSGVNVDVYVDGMPYATNAPGHTVVSGNDEDPDGNPIGDFYYFTNAGTNGTAISSLANGDARSILNTDGFAGNNDGGSGGTSLQHAVLDVSQFDLPAGIVKVVISGTVKGTLGAADIGFSVVKEINIITRNP